MKVTFGNNFIPQAPVAQQSVPPATPMFAAQKPGSKAANNAGNNNKDAFVRSIKFGNELLDPDLGDFLDMLDGHNPPDHLLDKIIRGNQKVNEDGSISFPVNRVPRPNFNYNPNPPNSVGDEGQDGDGDGQGQPGPGQPGPPGPGQPGTGVGDGDTGDEVGEGEGEGEGGDQAGEGEGDYGRESWSPPYSPSEIAKLMGKSWGLPFIEDRGKGEMKETFETHDSRRKVPPGKIKIRQTMANIAGRKLTLDIIDNENLDMGLKRLNPALAAFEQKITALQAQPDSADDIQQAATEFLRDELKHFENNALPIVEKSRDPIFTKALEAFKTELRKNAATPAFLSEALPTFKTALANIKRRNADDDENMLVGESDIVRMDTRIQTKPHTQAVIFYIMDVSGSISNDMKQMARTNNFLLSTWLKFQYGMMAAKSQGKKYTDKDFFGKGVQERFIIHTDGAKEVSGEEFYTTRQSGGTTISSAYKLLEEIIEEEYPPDKWNIYVVQYSDGDSWGDNHISGEIIDRLFSKYDANMLGYVNLRDPRWGWFGSDNFDSFLKERYANQPRVRRAALTHNSLDVYKNAIKTLLEPADEKGGKKA